MYKKNQRKDQLSEKYCLYWGKNKNTGNIISETSCISEGRGVQEKTETAGEHEKKLAVHRRPPFLDLK